MDYSLETGIIRDKIDEFFERHDIEVEITVTPRGSDIFDATATYTYKRLWTGRSYYSIKLKNGNELMFL